jgi:hypothetical protein
VSRRLAVLSLGFLLAGCSQAGVERPSGAESTSDVVYAGETTDEALDRLLDVAPVDIASKRLRILAPADGDVLRAATAIEFEVAMPGATSLLRLPSPGPAKPSVGSFLRQVGHWLQPIGVAHAHGTPFSGTGYLFRVSAADGVPALLVFSDAQRYTPSEEAWARMAQAPQPLELSVIYAFFEDNAIPEGGGPFAGGEVAFRLK